MQKTNIHLPEIKLAGLKVRTNNKTEMEQINPKIGPCVQNYYQNHAKGGRIFCAYTEYESDCNGDYTFFIGEEVSQLSDKLETLIIPAQHYEKFTTNPGPMPMVVINAWQEIWAMPLPRSYKTDFEIYDQRASDPNKTILDIYIGIK